MSLDLDARQRAMLQEMGITIWQPAAPENKHTSQHRRGAVQPSPEHVTATPAPSAAAQSRPEPQTANRHSVQPAAMHLPAHAQVGTSSSERNTAPAEAPHNMQLRLPVAVYASADAHSTPPDLGSGWLVITESSHPDQPFSGDAGKLLDNMLRAMQLHRHPRTFIAVLERSSTPHSDTPAVKQALLQALSELRPAIVLILGLGAARTLLNSREPLGRLRANVHQLADGIPAVISYDPAYLLRAPDAKAAAWADLCKALAVVRANTSH